MPNSFTGLNMAGNALRNFQLALDTTGHNVANVNTPGYSRQTISFTAAPSSTVYGSNGAMQVGNGITTSSLSRIRDQYLDVSSHRCVFDFRSVRRLEHRDGRGSGCVLRMSMGAGSMTR